MQVRASFSPARFRSTLLDTTEAAVPESSRCKQAAATGKLPQAASRPRRPADKHTKQAQHARENDPSPPSASRVSIYGTDFGRGKGGGAADNAAAGAGCAHHAGELLRARRALVAASEWAALEALDAKRAAAEQEARGRAAAEARAAQTAVLQAQVRRRCKCCAWAHEVNIAGLSYSALFDRPIFFLPHTRTPQNPPTRSPRTRPRGRPPPRRRPAT
jgi:hypothetical protein